MEKVQVQQQKKYQSKIKRTERNRDRQTKMNIE